MSKIQATPDWNLSSEEMLTQIDLSRFNGDTISDGAAVRVASWYQSPGTVGHVLASLASGQPVERAELFDDLSRTLAEVRANVLESDADRVFNLQALQALVLWALDAPEVD
jgi:hypothetical protein